MKIKNNKYKFLQINNKIQPFKIENKFNIILIMRNKLINLIQTNFKKIIKKFNMKENSVNSMKNT